MKLCFVMPEYNPADATHFSHIADFVQEASTLTDISLIIERGVKPRGNLGCRSVHALRFQSLPLRMLELLSSLFLIRLKGVKTFYIHYSFVAAWSAAIITALFGGRVFYWNCGEPWKYQRSFLRNIFERLAYRVIDMLVTGTEKMKMRYAQEYGIPLSKIAVMPNWIMLERFSFSDAQSNQVREQLNIPAGTPILLFIHRLSRRKGAHHLPVLLEKLHDEKFVLIIIGDGPERRIIESSIERLGMSEKVRFIGNVPNREILHYYAAADAFIMPSEEEGFPRVLLEAMATRTSFAAFDVGGVREIVPPEFQRYVAPSADVDAFARIVRELLHLPDYEKKELGRIALSWVQQFSIQPVARKFFAILSHS